MIGKVKDLLDIALKCVELYKALRDLNKPDPPPETKGET